MLIDSLDKLLAIDMLVYYINSSLPHSSQCWLVGFGFFYGVTFASVSSLYFVKRLNFVLAPVNSESSFGYNVTESAAAIIIDTYH